jgi:hypothetical protein
MNNDDRDKMIIEIHAAVHGLIDEVKRHDKSLYGNGQPGLIHRFDVLEVKCRLFSKWSIAIITGISTVCGGVVGAVATTIFKGLIK